MFIILDSKALERAGACAGLKPCLVIETWQQGGDLYGLKFWKS